MDLIPPTEVFSPLLEPGSEEDEDEDEQEEDEGDEEDEDVVAVVQDPVPLLPVLVQRRQMQSILRILYVYYYISGNSPNMVVPFRGKKERGEEWSDLDFLLPLQNGIARRLVR